MGCEALPIEYYFSKSDSNESLFLLGSVCSENRLYRVNPEPKKIRLYAVFQPAIFNYRYYNPAQGKWLSRDPIQEKGGLNLYGFVGNNGINYWDTFGEKASNGQESSSSNNNGSSKVVYKLQKKNGKKIVVKLLMQDLKRILDHLKYISP